MKIPNRVRAFILAQAPAERKRLIAMLERIEADPLVGTPLPVPYQPGVLGVNFGDKYFITYRIQDTVEVGSITHVLDFESILRSLQED